MSEVGCFVYEYTDLEISSGFLRSQIKTILDKLYLFRERERGEAEVLFMGEYSRTPELYIQRQLLKYLHQHVKNFKENIIVVNK